MIREIYRRNGVKGFFRGHLGTLVRETGGSAAWFGIYEIAVQYFLHKREHLGLRPCQKADLPTYQLLLSGAMAGVGYNMMLFPADTIKSRMQVLSESQGKLGFCDVGVRLWKAEGIRGLYRGGLLTAMKSIPSSAVIFGVYETLSRRF
jgi:ornithine carrier protein